MPVSVARISNVDVYSTVEIDDKLATIVAALPEDGKDGEDGIDGITPTITVGNVTTGEPGTEAVVTAAGTPTAVLLDFTIPRGDKGDPGAPAQGGAAARPGVVNLDSFTGNDDQKLTAALTYAAAQAQIPAIQFPARTVTLTKPQTAFGGMKLIGPNVGGPMNLEYQNGKLVNHVVKCTGLPAGQPLFTNTGELFDVYVSGLAFQGSFNQQFWRSTGNLYACKFDNLTFYGFKHIFGNATERALMTYTKFTGSWQVIGVPSTGPTMLFHVAGSDCDFWTAGDLNVGPTKNTVEGDFLLWFDGMGKTNVGSLYCTTGGTKGIRISGNPEASPINFNGLRLEGYHSSNPGTRLLQIDSGIATFSQCWFAYGRSVSIAANSKVSFSQCTQKEVTGLPSF